MLFLLLSINFDSSSHCLKTSFDVLCKVYLNFLGNISKVKSNNLMVQNVLSLTHPYE